FALPARQVTSSRASAYQQQQHSLGGSPYQPNGLALPGPSPLGNSYEQQQQQPLPAKAPSPPPVSNAVASLQCRRQSPNTVAGPSTPPAAAVSSTPIPLTLKQQHITAVKGIIPTLQNIIATVSLDCRLDLKTIALHARSAEYNPKCFAAVIMRIHYPKTTALIFASGKMAVTGAKSEDDSHLDLPKYARTVQKLGFNAKFSEFKMQNIVGSCDVKFNAVDLLEEMEIVDRMAQLVDDNMFNRVYVSI
ncbi:hypothetical protein C8R45DRAFT_823430, partial [Mycena sanguinolenta]